MQMAKNYNIITGYERKNSEPSQYYFFNYMLILHYLQQIGNSFVEK